MDARKHKTGAYDTEMRTAMLDFQQKHAVMDQADIKRATLEALARQPLENDFAALGACSPNARCTPPASSRTAASASSVSNPARTRPISARTARGTASPIWRRPSRDATLEALGHRDAPTTRSRSSAATRAPTSAG